ncbi:MAG TPA: hypothetical protein VHY10_16330 [Xanthobacteraceae bacterium]|jgi:uncharacterized protein YdaT|nr:hypothetical protein [Xanthobacteraceae bacterium]
MPWPTGKSFAGSHNKKLKGAAALKAAHQATALVDKGMPEGEAIAIANKTGDEAMSDADRMTRRYGRKPAAKSAAKSSA